MHVTTELPFESENKVVDCVNLVLYASSLMCVTCNNKTYQ